MKAIKGRNEDNSLSLPADQAIAAISLLRVPRLMALIPGGREPVAFIPYCPMALINAEYGRGVFTRDMNSSMFDAESLLDHCFAKWM